MGVKEITLHAQLTAKAFYARLGYREEGDGVRGSRHRACRHAQDDRVTMRCMRLVNAARTCLRGLPSGLDMGRVRCSKSRSHSADLINSRDLGRKPMTLIRRRFLSLAGAALAAPAVVAAGVVAGLSEPPGARRRDARGRRRHRLPGAADRRAGVARARPADGDREPDRRRRNDRHRDRRQEPARRLHGAVLQRQHRERAADPEGERRLQQGSGAGDLHRAPAAGVGGACVAEDQHAAGIRRRDEEEPRQGLRDVGRGLEPALPGRMVPQGGRASSSITCRIAAPVRR